MSISLKKLKKRALPAASEEPQKKKKMPARFEGTSEEELMSRASSLSDYLQPRLDLVFVGINPSLTAAHTGHYYAGPGNHFYKLLHESGLVPEPLGHEDDARLLEYGIGLTNIVARATRSSADLSRLELKKGAAAAQEKLQRYAPRVAVFNGKCIYEEFDERYDRASFRFGLQPRKVSETALWVVPSSSARCANFPRMQDKLHFYTALKKYLGFLKGEIEEVDLEEFRFDGKCRQKVPSTSKMWRRKGISAFAGGGRIVNKETVCMDTSEEYVLTIPQSSEFILKNVKKQESSEEDIDSGVSTSQSSGNSQELLQKSEIDADQISSQNSNAEAAYQETSRQNEHENDENYSNKQNDSKPKKRQQNRRATKDKLSSRAVVYARKEKSETIDFVSLIKQRLSHKGEVSNDHGEDCQDKSPSQASSSVKGLKYENLRSNKSKLGFKVKT